MGGFLSGVLGTDSEAQINKSVDPYAALQPWQQTAQGLNAQLATEAAGGGPNPAQQQFLQNSQNIAQQQANVYSQNRALNPGLAARMAGNTAGNLQQNAASTAGIQQANQQLSAQQLQGGLIHSQEQALNQAGAVNAGIAGGNQQQAGQIVGGLFGGAGAALMAKGGTVPGYAEGGDITVPTGSDWSQWAQNNTGIPSAQDWALTMGAPQPGPAAAPSPAGASSGVGKFLSGFGKSVGSSKGPGIASGFKSFMSAYGGGMSQGGKVPVLLSPGEKYLKPDQAERVATGDADPLKTGETIPGKAKVSGDSTENDTVAKQADPGGLVIPRSILNSEDPEREARKFITQEMRKHRKSPEGEFHAALKRAVAGRKNR